MGCKLWDIIKNDFKSEKQVLEIKSVVTGLYVDVSPLVYKLGPHKLEKFKALDKALTQLNFDVTYVFDNRIPETKIGLLRKNN